MNTWHLVLGAGRVPCTYGLISCQTIAHTLQAYWRKCVSLSPKKGMTNEKHLHGEGEQAQSAATQEPGTNQ